MLVLVVVVVKVLEDLEEGDDREANGAVVGPSGVVDAVLRRVALKHHDEASGQQHVKRRRREGGKGEGGKGGVVTLRKRTIVLDMRCSDVKQRPSDWTSQEMVRPQERPWTAGVERPWLRGRSGGEGRGGDG